MDAVAVELLRTALAIETGVLPVKFVMPEEPVGFGLAAWMPPETAQVP